MNTEQGRYVPTRLLSGAPLGGASAGGVVTERGGAKECGVVTGPGGAGERSVVTEPGGAEQPSGAGERSGAEERGGAGERGGAEAFGPLAPWVADSAVTDIFVNGSDDLWVDRGSGLVRAQAWSCPGEPQLRELAVRLVALGGRHIDEANPCVDVRLHDGIRLHAVLPPVASRGTVVSIRVPPVQQWHLDELQQLAFFGGAGGATVLRQFIDDAVRGRANILISGAGGAGKTTLLGALLSAAPPGERIIAIEDVAELRVDHPHFVSLEARQPNLEGAGAITLDRLLREALRMRPDRLVLGECRGSEIRELLSALNTGHDGGAGTVHANSLGDVPARLEALGALAGLSPDALARQVVSALQLVLHVERRGSVRRLAEVGAFALDPSGRLQVHPVDISAGSQRSALGQVGRSARPLVGASPAAHVAGNAITAEAAPGVAAAAGMAAVSGVAATPEKVAAPVKAAAPGTAAATPGGARGRVGRHG